MDENAGQGLAEFQSIISKMSVEVCCAAVLPELGVRWPDVRQAMRSYRLPMTAPSVARVLRRHVARTRTLEEVHEIVAKLRITLVASSGTRAWHAVRLSGGDGAAATEDAARVVRRARRAAPANLRARLEVHAAKLGDFMLLSLRRCSAGPGAGPGTGAGGGGRALYVAAPPGEPVAFLTSLGAAPLALAAVNGLGFASYTNANLYGRDLVSLLKIMDRTWNADVRQLTECPAYAPAPVITNAGIDYTNKTYNENYVDNIIGPDPPLINNLDLKSERPFYDRAMLNKSVTVTFSLKSDDVSKTLKSWVRVKAIPPTSEFIRIFHRLKSNKFTYNREDDEELV